MPFGHAIFALGPDVFDPTSQGSVDPDYPIGPNDELIITVWGQVEFTYNLTVDREGSINIPAVGLMFVNGIALKDLQQRIAQRMSRAYSGIREDRAKATTFIDVALGKVKTIKVFVTGEVRRPSSYLMPANASVMSALYYAGGPVAKGSMRDVRLLRYGEKVGSVDLYKFILEGDKGQDVRIQNNDVILVPPQGIEVTLNGRVHREGIYELRKGEGLKRLLEIAGGLEADAHIARIQIERIEKHRDFIVVDVDWNHLLTVAEDAALFDGDRITVFQIPSPTLKKVVVLKGLVRNPGTYELKPSMRVSDLIQRTDGLFPDVYLGRADIQRTRSNMTRELISFNLNKALKGDPAHDILLAPLDEVSIYSIHTFGKDQYVTIEGVVQTPGRYELLEGMGLQDLIVLAGGLLDIAYKVEAEVSRSDPTLATSDQSTTVYKIPISDRYEIDGEQADAFPLQDRDMVFIRLNPDFAEAQQVVMEGEIRFSGAYTLERGSTRLSDMIQRAGGLKSMAYSEGARLYRPSTEDSIAIDLPEALKNSGGKSDPILYGGDVIHIPRKPTTVEITGAVYQPGHVFFQPGKGVGYYLNRAGGPTKDAIKSHIYAVLANGEVVKPGGFLFWKSWPKLNAGSRIVVPSSKVENREEIDMDAGQR
jgi:protein involved in polysaccharide export with SLBB domain